MGGFVGPWYLCMLLKQYRFASNPTVLSAFAGNNHDQSYLAGEYKSVIVWTRDERLTAKGDHGRFYLVISALI